MNSSIGLKSPWFWLFAAFLMNGFSLVKSETKAPIIGILTQEVDEKMRFIYSNPTHRSYIAASYVKFMESAGARVVPVWTGRDVSFYEEIISKLNGILFPGGSVMFSDVQGYADAGFKIYTIAKRINDRGDYFPLWGTCLGFELLIYLSANRSEYRTECNSEKQSLPLFFNEGIESSKMFTKATPDIISILSTENVTSNFHHFCATEKNFTKFGLDKRWRILSTNRDLSGVKFISSIESKKYPFYGVQFHPEKNIFEWVKGHNIDHSQNAIKACRYFGDFFVSEAMKNNHSFVNELEEEEMIIYNYQPTYTGMKGSVFEQCYFFSQ